MTFRVDQQVACITDEGWEKIDGSCTTGPAKGDVVTITGIWPLSECTYLTFAEWGCDGFEATAFSPLVKPPATSIAVFEQILRDTTREVEPA